MKIRSLMVSDFFMGYKQKIVTYQQLFLKT